MELLVELRKSHLFHFMDESDLKKVIENAGSTCIYKMGKQLFFEGDVGDHFFVLIEGKIRISRTTKEGRETVLKDMMPGDSFAEIILFEQHLYPATATALVDSKVLRIERSSFKSMLSESNNSEIFIINLIKKIRFLARKVELFNNAEVHDRFFHFIETYYGKKEVIEFVQSKKEIAQTIGTIPETFSRMINKLKANNVILSWDKNELVLKKGFWNEY